jgi:hypothetical protein
MSKQEKQLILTIELVPKTAWFTNLRSYLTSKEWDVVRKKCYKEANYCCEICGGKGNTEGMSNFDLDWEGSTTRMKLNALLKQLGGISEQ